MGNVYWKCCTNLVTCEKVTVITLVLTTSQVLLAIKNGVERYYLQYEIHLNICDIYVTISDFL